jgi:hypothetical protein
MVTTRERPRAFIAPISEIAAGSEHLSATSIPIGIVSCDLARSTDGVADSFDCHLDLSRCIGINPHTFMAFFALLKIFCARSVCKLLTARSRSAI